MVFMARQLYDSSVNTLGIFSHLNRRHCFADSSHEGLKPSPTECNFYQKTSESGEINFKKTSFCQDYVWRTLKVAIKRQTSRKVNSQPKNKKIVLNSRFSTERVN